MLTPKLVAAIEECYQAFAACPRPTSLGASPLRDGKEVLAKLSAAPLRQLTGEQLGPYASWALTTVGDGDDYRHFLPRIFELSVDNPVWLGAEPPVMADKLNRAEWRSWPTKQRNAARSFFHAAFDYVLRTHPDEGL